MQTAEALIQTSRPGRYLAQLCRHAGSISGFAGHRGGPSRHQNGDGGQVRHAEWTQDQGVIKTDWGDCTLSVSPEGLRLRAEAADADSLRRLQDLIARRLERFGRREKLHVTWVA